MTDFKYITVTPAEKYCILTLNRPEKRNAMNKAMREEFLMFFETIAPKFEIIILTGAGKGFCAGMDLREQGLSEGAAHFVQIPQAIYESKCIVVVLVNGAARGGGVMVANACDLAIGSEIATFGMPDISSNGDPAFADPDTQKVIREKTSQYLALAGKSINANDAKDFGLLNEVVTHESLLIEGERLVSKLLDVGITHLQTRKAAVNKRPFENALRIKKDGLAKMFQGG